MSVSSNLSRKLFAQMPPSIVITEPVPRWQAWVQGTIKGGILMLLCAVSFYAGVMYGRTQHSVTITDAATPAPAPAEAVAKTGEADAARGPQEMLAEAIESRSIEGLEIQTLEITADRAVPGQLRYEFTVANEGRRYEGSLEFLVLGERDGRPAEWLYPSEAQRGDGAYRMRVGRYLKTSGTLQLPAGLVPQAVALRLREPSGVRASRGVILSESQPGKEQPRAAAR